MENRDIKKRSESRLSNVSPLFEQVRQRIIPFRDSEAILDADVAELYGVKTKEINQAVRNNPEKFPAGYSLELSEQVFIDLRSKSLTANISPKSRVLPKAFTEYTEAFAMVRQLKHELRVLHSETDDKKQQSIQNKFSLS